MTKVPIWRRIRRLITKRFFGYVNINDFGAFEEGLEPVAWRYRLKKWKYKGDEGWEATTNPINNPEPFEIQPLILQDEDVTKEMQNAIDYCRTTKRSGIWNWIKEKKDD